MLQPERLLAGRRCRTEWVPGCRGIRIRASHDANLMKEE